MQININYNIFFLLQLRMSLTLAPSRQVLSQPTDVPDLYPVYKPGFTFSKMPASLLTLVPNKNNNVDLLHLRSGFSDADSALFLKSPSLATRVPTCSVVTLAALVSSYKLNWVTLLEVLPASLVFALLSDTGQVLFFQLCVRCVSGHTSLVVDVKKEETHTIHTLDLPKTGSLETLVTGAVSVCLNGRRYFFVQTSNQKWTVFQVNVDTQEITRLKNPQADVVYRDVLQDYNTENNVIGVKSSVLFYDQVPICKTERTYRVCSVFGTCCEAFHLLVHNGEIIEWWRWTGNECEAVVLTGLKSVVGNLVWL